MDTSTQAQVVKRYPPFRMSPETTALINDLRALEPGEVLTYEELHSRRGVDYQDKKRGCFYTAQKNLWNEEIFIDTVTKAGFRRLTEAEAVDFAQGRRELATRHTKKTMGVLVKINADKLDDDAKKHLEMERLRSGAMFRIATVDTKKLNPANTSGKAPNIKAFLNMAADKET